MEAILLALLLLAVACIFFWAGWYMGAIWTCSTIGNEEVKQESASLRLYDNFDRIPIYLNRDGSVEVDGRAYEWCDQHNRGISIVLVHTGGADDDLDDSA